MKKICFLLLMMLVFSAAHAQRKTSLDQGWKFHRGDVVNGEAIDFNDTRWRTLTVPHDFSMEPAFIPSIRLWAVRVGTARLLNCLSMAALNWIPTSPRTK